VIAFRKKIVMMMRKKKMVMMRRRKIEKAMKMTEQRRGNQLLLKVEMVGKDNLVPLQVCGECTCRTGYISCATSFQKSGF